MALTLTVSYFAAEKYGTDTELLKANQTIYHDQMRASHILLPVIPR